MVQDKTASLKEKRKMREHVFHIYFFDLMLRVISVILCTLCVFAKKANYCTRGSFR